MAEKQEQKQKMQQKYMELQLLNQNILQVQKQITQLDQQAAELEAIIVGVQDLSEIKEGTEILVPVANGIYAKAELKDGKNLIVNIGAGTTVTKKHDKVAKLLSDQIIEIAKVQNELTIQFQKFQEQALNIQKELQEINKNV